MRFYKKVLLSAFLLFSISALAAGSEIHRWTEVIDAIIKVESEYKTDARCGIYVGPMQISPIMVKECNAILEDMNVKTRYTLDDRYSLKKSKEMFRLFQRKYNPTGDVEWAVRSWNGGPRFSRKATEAYYKKVIAALK